MEEWKEYRLDTICNLSAGGDAPHNAVKVQTAEMNIPIYSNGESERGLYGYTNSYKVEAPAVTISARGNIGYVCYRKENFVPIVRLITAKANEQILSNEFLYYCLCNTRIWGDGSVQKQLTVPMISEYLVRIPPLSIQSKIVAILKSLDDEVNKRINDNFYYAIFEVLLIWLVTSLRNDNLEQQAQALFKSWLVDFEPFRDQPFVESELGMIPEGWRVIELEETCTIRYGKGLGKKDLTQDGFPVFGGNGIIGFYTHFLYELPQILVSCRGAASGKIIESLPKSYVTSNSLVLELKDRSYYNYIKLLLLNNPLYDYATGSAQPQITIDNIKGIKILLPLKEVINKVNHTLENIGSIQRNNNEESRRLASLRDTLLPRLMSGELKVEDVAL